MHIHRPQKIWINIDPTLVQCPSSENEDIILTRASACIRHVTDGSSKVMPYAE